MISNQICGAIIACLAKQKPDKHHHIRIVEKIFLKSLISVITPVPKVLGRYPLMALEP